MVEGPREPRPSADSVTAASTGKANFDAIYDWPDPSRYCRVLSALDYQIPEHGSRVFRSVLEAMPSPRPQRTVLDVCCSYGFIGAMLKYEVELGELYDHYCAGLKPDLSTAEMAAADRRFYADRPRSAAPAVVGLDQSEPAITYGCAAGLLDDGYAENLEVGPPSSTLSNVLPEVDLVTVTGGIGYITERTFDHLFDAVGEAATTPWVAAFALRMFPYDAIAATLADHGLVTERLDGVSFPQRRFVDDAERAHAFDQLASLGVDPAGTEADGRYHAEFFLSRPAAYAGRCPLNELVSTHCP